MFSRGRKGKSWLPNICTLGCNALMIKDAPVRDRLAFLIGSFSKPFDARFSELMKKMNTSQQLFESELYVEDQEELMYQFRQFEKEMDQDDQRSISEKLQENLKNEQEYKRLAGE